MTKYNFELLTRLKKDFTNDLEQNVVSDLVEYGEDWYTYLQDVLQHGCVSGMVGKLTYYNQTEAFHDLFEDEIDNLIHSYIDEMGIEFSELASKIDVWDIQQLKNWKSWFAYESILQQIYFRLESENYDTEE